MPPSSGQRPAGTHPVPAAMGDFFICDLPWAWPKDDMASMEHPLFTLATRPDRRILRYAHGEATIEVTPSVKGLATIHDKDVLIYCVSQLMAALNEGRDLAITTDFRAVLCALSERHMRIPDQALEKIFPQYANGAKGVPNLFV